MKCRICGFDLNQGETFCKNCGASNTSEELPVIKTSDERIEKVKEPKNNNSFLLAIAIFTTIIALVVVIYLVYSTLKAQKSEKTSNDITIVTTNSYYVNYKNHTFTLNPEMNIKVYNDFLELTSKNYKVKLFYENNTNYEQVNLDLIKNAYLDTTDYTLQEPSLKTKDELSYYFADIDYNDGKKTSLVIVPDKTSGYWFLEIGTSFEDYPTSEIIDEVLKLVLESVNTEEENKLNLEFNNVIQNINE